MSGHQLIDYLQFSCVLEVSHHIWLSRPPEPAERAPNWLFSAISLEFLLCVAQFLKCHII